METMVSWAMSIGCNLKTRKHRHQHFRVWEIAAQQCPHLLCTTGPRKEEVFYLIWPLICAKLREKGGSVETGEPQIGHMEEIFGDEGDVGMVGDREAIRASVPRTPSEVSM